jgi:hypothetical protein
MASLMEIVEQHLGANEISQLSQQIGADPSTTQQAISAALPMIVGGMAQTASDPEGSQNLHAAVDAHEGALASLGSMLGAAPIADSGGLLGRILGHTQAPVQQGVAKASGLDPEQAKKLLFYLAPVVLAVLARKRQQQQLGSGQVGSVLQQEQAAAQTRAQQHAPSLGGLLGQIFGAHQP